MEREWISWLRGRLPAHPRLRLGPGDDAALIRWAAGPDCVATSDLLADGVHFCLTSENRRGVGRKALAVNLSDLAAMAAVPVAAVVSLLLPREGARELAAELYEGMLPLAEQFTVAIAGGDTNCWDGPLVVSVTALGDVQEGHALRRGGAQVGDWLVVTGQFGGSLSGHHLDFTPRVREALQLARSYRLHAGIDVSDGLSLDVWRMAQESGCGVELEGARIPISDAARQLAERDGRAPLEHALADGEDFELALAVPEDEARRMVADQPLDAALTAIGRFVGEPGLWQRMPDGTRQPLQPAGYEHGAR